MPPRRSHTKSRRGCLQCKQRHVKCDETVPRCGYCVKRELTCSFRSSKSAPASPFSVSEGFAASPLQPSTASPLHLPPTSRALELKLMHNWSTSTYKTMEQHSDETILWQITVPELALSYDYLLDALLALSARHLSFKDPPQTALWDCAALDYQNRAITRFQQILGSNSINSKNCEAVFACSVLTMVLPLAQSYRQEHNTFSHALTNIIELRQFLKGVWAVHINHADQIRAGGFQVLFTYHTPKQILSGDAPGVPLGEMYSLLDDNLQKLRLEACNNNNEHHYHDAISHLRQAMHAYCTGGVFSSIMAWPVSLADEFVQLVEEKNSVALAIIAHYGVVLDFLRDRWWVRDAGKRLVETILSLLRESEPEFAQSVNLAWVARG